MNRKLIGIIIVMLFISAMLISVKSLESAGPNDLPIPGDMNENELDLIGEYPTRPIVPYETSTVNFNNNIASLIQQVDEELYLDYLEGLVAFGPRVTGSQECYDSGDYIYDEFVKMGLDTRKHYWERNSLNGNNIEATIYGVDETSDQIFVVCAHYDSVPSSPGADDDGSGVAAVISAARAMNNYEFNHTIRFVAFSGEEQGIYGSYFYVEEADNNNDNIIAALNADMIGYAETEEDRTHIRIYHQDHPLEWLIDYTSEVAKEYHDYIDINVVPSGYSWGSDHYRFWEAGYEAIFYAEYNFNAYYHSPEDTIENMDIGYAVRSSRLIIATLAELSELNERNAPYKPIQPQGPATGEVRTELTYTTSTIDPQDDQVYYLWDWGDGADSGWIGPYNSEETCTASHTWNSRNSFSIRVKSKDVNDYESEWSDPLEVSMPRNKIINPFEKILENHPHLFPLLRKILRLQ